MVGEVLESGHLWPEPLIQMNPAFESGRYVDDLVSEGLLHPECRHIFAMRRPMMTHPVNYLTTRSRPSGGSRAQSACVLTTGTGSGKSLSYIVPIVNDVLQHSTAKGEDQRNHHLSDERPGQ